MTSLIENKECSYDPLSRWVFVPLRVLLLAFILCPYQGLAQRRFAEIDLNVYPQSGNLLFLSDPDSVYLLNMETWDRVSIAAMPDASHFLETSFPIASSATVVDTTLWLWDASVGSTFSFGPSGLTGAFPQYPSRTRFDHAATTRPDTGEPLVFGGYGYYRAKDFFIYFDTALEQWRELPHQYGPYDPEPQVGASLLDIGNGRDVYMVQGHVSAEQSMPYYVERTQPLALLFDIEKREWRPAPMNEEVACLISTQAKNNRPDFRGVGKTFAGMLYPISQGCSYYFEGKPRRASLVFWRPDREEWALQDLDTELPANHHLVGFSFNDQTATAYFLKLPGLDEKEIHIRSFAIADTLVWLPLPEVAAPPVRWYWWLVTLPALGAFGVGIWFFRFRQCLYMIPEENILFIRKGTLVLQKGLLPNASVILSFLCEHPRGKWLNREELEYPFTSMAYEPDALRTTVNRALSNVNDIGQQEMGLDVVERRPSLSDKRKQKYRLNPKVKWRRGGFKWLSK